MCLWFREKSEGGNTTTIRERRKKRKKEANLVLDDHDDADDTFFVASERSADPGMENAIGSGVNRKPLLPENSAAGVG